MKNFPLSILIADELYTSAERINTIITEGAVEDVYVTTLQSLIQPSIHDLAVALGKDTDSEYTNLLAEKDSDRDTAFIGFRDYSRAFISHRDAEKAKAGQLLVDAIQARGWSLHSYGYAQETSQINVLLEDLENEKNAVELIGAASWVSELAETQKEFETVYKQKISAEAQENYPLVTETRKKLIQYLDALLNYINMNTQLNGNLFKPVEQEIDEVIVDIVTVARARRTRKVNKTEDEVE